MDHGDGSWPRYGYQQVREPHRHRARFRFLGCPYYRYPHCHGRTLSFPARPSSALVSGNNHGDLLVVLTIPPLFYIIYIIFILLVVL